MAQVSWTLQALDDLDAICLFIARDNPRIAQIFAHRAFRAADRLAEFPQRGHKVPELGKDDIREIFLQSYREIRGHNPHLPERLANGVMSPYFPRASRHGRFDTVVSWQKLTLHHGARLLSADDLSPEE